MTRADINAVLEGVRSWPQEDQEELAELAREIAARRTGVYVMDAEERAAVRRGLDEATRGEFVPLEEMSAIWKRYGVLLGSGIRRKRAAISSKFTFILSNEVPVAP